MSVSVLWEVPLVPERQQVLYEWKRLRGRSIPAGSVLCMELLRGAGSQDSNT